MRKIINILIVAGVIILLTGCGNSPSSSPDTNNSDTNKTEALVGGTADHPKVQEFDKPYLVTPELGKTYVKVSVDKYQRIVFERVSDKICSFNDSNTYFSTLYDDTLQTKPLYAFGATQNRGHGQKEGVHDLIFLKSGTYVFEYSMPRMYHRETDCTTALLTARDMGSASLEKIVNRGKYSRNQDGDNSFYLLEMKNDGIVNFKGSYGILYDDDLNIIENIDYDSDINVSLSQGNYYLRPTGDTYYKIMVTFNP